jgi:pimeloyl-ACP methyl ester carboxylesterase
MDSGTNKPDGVTSVNISVDTMFRRGGRSGTPIDSPVRVDGVRLDDIVGPAGLRLVDRAARRVGISLDEPHRHTALSSLSEQLNKIVRLTAGIHRGEVSDSVAALLCEHDAFRVDSTGVVVTAPFADHVDRLRELTRQWNPAGWARLVVGSPSSQIPLGAELARPSEFSSGGRGKSLDADVALVPRILQSEDRANAAGPSGDGGVEVAPDNDSHDAAKQSRSELLRHLTRPSFMRRVGARVALGLLALNAPAVIQAVDHVAPAPCTSESVNPGQVGDGRIIVLVAGLGTSSESATAYNDFDAESLGYEESNTYKFSYNGGDIRDNPFRGKDTQVDIQDSARKFHEFVSGIRRANPDVPIDVVGHSLGGVVARIGLSNSSELNIDTLVTYNSPHSGVDLLSFADIIRRTDKGREVSQDVVDDYSDTLDLDSTAVHQLAPSSNFMVQLSEDGAPDVDRFVSVAERFDVMVQPFR